MTVAKVPLTVPRPCAVGAQRGSGNVNVGGQTAGRNRARALLVLVCAEQGDTEAEGESLAKIPNCVSSAMPRAR